MLTLFWIVGVTNAFNLLDNMDGLCAGTALIAGTFLLIGRRQPGPGGAPALYLAGAARRDGRVPRLQRHPASIFMGDTGSLFLGLNLAALTLRAEAARPGRSGCCRSSRAGAAAAGADLRHDAGHALRLLSGRIAVAGRTRSQLAPPRRVGLSEPRAVATLWMLAAAGGLIGPLLRADSAGPRSLAALGSCSR
jgi:UDP-GlcNAc:undecaprenyl-phosphate GlcNAc-1-phosphate transferase